MRDKFSFICYSRRKEVTYEKIKWIVYERYSDKRSLEGVLVVLFQTDITVLMYEEKPSIMELTDESQAGLCSRKRGR